MNYAIKKKRHKKIPYLRKLYFGESFMFEGMFSINLAGLKVPKLINQNLIYSTVDEERKT